MSDEEIKEGASAQWFRDMYEATQIRAENARLREQVKVLREACRQSLNDTVYDRPHLAAKVLRAALAATEERNA